MFYDEGYSKIKNFWGCNPGSLVTSSIKYFSDLSSLKSLDAGCGTGKNAYFLALHNIDVLAIDISEIAIKNAKELWTPFPNLRFESQDVRKLKLDSELFDIVISTGMVHCLYDQTEITLVLEKLFNSLKSNGIFAFSTFNNDRMNNFNGHDRDFMPCLLPHKFYIEFFLNTKSEILFETNTFQPDIHPHNLIEHYHSITRILIRK